MSDSKKKVPKRRFEEFSNANAWEQRKLGEVVDFLNGKAYKQQELLEFGKFRVLRVGNFNTNDRWYYSDLELDENKYANKGDLLYLWATNFGPEIWNEERVIYHYHIWKLQFLSNELDKQYLYTWLLTDKEKIKQTTNGTTMVHVTKGSIEQREFQYPTNKKEQQKIGMFFKQLDNTIALHQRKLEKIKALKTAYLSEMFPAEGESKPKRRFAGFTGDWEQRKLGEITLSYSGGTPLVSKSEYYGDDIPFIRSAEINSDSTELCLTKVGLKNSSAKLVKAGDILYALYGATSGETGISRINGAINQAILAIHPMKGYESQFLVQWLRYQKKKIISRYIQGGQGNLSSTIIKNLDIKLPSLKEQIKIGTFFLELDNTITLHQRKLKKLQNIKKAYLNEMFI
ncbi:restriction endonuclease subunit S [Listeria seeligeri]|nr:restriction endonuclease subunit S [Listeria seeligeri]MBC1756376.1 restriction endonuclease subunit S [Listeria seeligeri]MBC1815160.1 restriction endonuclease subunit S [Listeria seeligeri]MBC2029541.1 restriction endonuclease subunit S [Listeria seeligeri]MBC6113657.1 restriction endonuclease subunit S [Listeria seeligeri]MBC6159758.1 restriction endonuclease subunit S [Listeria seeligeri]